MFKTSLITHVDLFLATTYYEDKIRDFNKYRRGRTLAQFCRDEGIDYDWMLKTKRKYSGRTRQTQPEEPADETDSLPSLIELHFEDDSEPQAKEEPFFIPKT